MITILLFFIYSFFGWSIEVILTFIDQKKIINRGFLFGPYCPIYGIGTNLLVYLLHSYSNNFLLLFIISFLICLVIEYLFSFTMEKLFNLRWWDYSNRAFNINGRVCLTNCLSFGIVGTIVIKYLNNIFRLLLEKMPFNIQIVIVVIISVIMLFDFIISTFLVIKIKKNKRMKKDSTEQIKKQEKKMLNHYTS